MKTPGRKPSSGRFSSREELTAFVWQRWTVTDSSTTDIAVAARASPGVVQRILATLEGKPRLENEEQARCSESNTRST